MKETGYGQTVKHDNYERNRLVGTESAGGQPCLVCGSPGHQTVECPQLLSEARKRIEEENRRGERVNMAMNRSRKVNRKEEESDVEEKESSYES